jgi:hypothetical protein
MNALSSGSLIQHVGDKIPGGASEYHSPRAGSAKK